MIEVKIVMLIFIFGYSELPYNLAQLVLDCETFFFVCLWHVVPVCPCKQTCWLYTLLGCLTLKHDSVLLLYLLVGWRLEIIKNEIGNESWKRRLIFALLATQIQLVDDSNQKWNKSYPCKILISNQSIFLNCPACHIS